MDRKIAIYSFADVDRSGKVRWTAEELGYEIEERRVAPGEHRGEAYSAVNPYQQIPAAELNGETLIESTAICIRLAELHPEAGLIPSDTGVRKRFSEVVQVTTNTLEAHVVLYYLSKRGIVEPGWAGLVGESMGRKLQTFAARLPESGFLMGSFTVADIFAAYCLRIGVSAELLGMEGRVGSYLKRLMARPAAQRARFFDSLSQPVT